MNHFIVDGFNLAYRAHNVNFELKTASGEPSGMMFGFVRMMLSLKKKYRGYKFSVVWDNKPVHKFEIQPDYKAGRSSLPPLVMQQVDSIKEYLKNSGVDQYEEEGQEADDVIASLVEQIKAGDSGTIIVYSNDKDMLQLVEDGKVIIFKPKVGNSPEKFYDEEAVRETFGVSPKKLATYRSFDGDSSDNVKGISRVPRKIIASLVNECEGLDEIYTRLDQIKLTDFQKKAFEEGRERVANNVKIVALNRELTKMECLKGQFSKEKLAEILGRYEIKSVKPEAVVDIFSSSLNVKYTEPRPSYRLESYSLFDS